MEKDMEETRDKNKHEETRTIWTWLWQKMMEKKMEENLAAVKDNGWSWKRKLK